MKIISDFKINDNGYIEGLVKKGDVIATKCLKYIVTDCGYISERGTLITNVYSMPLITTIIKRECFDKLEDLLIEAEKRCKYEY